MQGMGLRQDESAIEGARLMAAAWQVTLSEEEDDPRTVAAHRLWLAENSLHREIWDRISRRWHFSHNLRVELLERLLRRGLAVAPEDVNYVESP